MESWRRGCLSERLLGISRADIFREQRSLSRMGRRARALQEKLSRPRGHGRTEFFGPGISFPWPRRGAGLREMAFEARDGRHWRSLHPGLAEVPRRLENHSRPHQHSLVPATQSVKALLCGNRSELARSKVREFPGFP